MARVKIVLLSHATKEKEDIVALTNAIQMSNCFKLVSASYVPITPNLLLMVSNALQRSVIHFNIFLKTELVKAAHHTLEEFQMENHAFLTNAMRNRSL